VTDTTTVARLTAAEEDFARGLMERAKARGVGLVGPGGFVVGVDEDSARVGVGGGALAEAVNGLYKAELVRGPGQGPWRTVKDVELATLGWVHWHNTARLHGYLGDFPPAEYETFYRVPKDTESGVESNNPSLHQAQSGSVILVT
jgi:hypothetical protein